MTSTVQLALFSSEPVPRAAPQTLLVAPFRTQLLKWIGNKQRFAHEIIGRFPASFGIYFEPFLGSGAVLGTLMPDRAVASDILKPLMEIWQTLSSDPNVVEQWYADRWNLFASDNGAYECIRSSYNASPNGADLLFLARSCYGGVVRFRQHDGYMSTPRGVHKPMRPEAFSKRVGIWHTRTSGTSFVLGDFEELMDSARSGDLIYCDPPYSHTQTILYGAQPFSLQRLFRAIDRCKSRGVRVVLSIDGTKQSGTKLCDVPIPDGLFERQAVVNCGRSMLKRFQMAGETLDGELVSDRLFLTY